MKRDYMMPEDMCTFKQDFPDSKSAAKMCRMIKARLSDTECHVRRGHVVYAKTHLSSNAWFLTFLTIMVMLKKNHTVEPSWIWKYINNCEEYCRRHLTWYMKTKDERRVSCKELLKKFGPLIGFHENKRGQIKKNDTRGS